MSHKRSYRISSPHIVDPDHSWSNALKSDEQSMFRLMIESAGDVVVLFDLNKKPVYVSPSSRNVLEIDQNLIVEYGICHVFDSEEVNKFERSIDAALTSQGKGQFTVKRHRRHGRGYAWIEVSARVVCDPLTGDGVGCIAVLRDITVRHEAGERFRLTAQHDALTGLPNRTVFRDRLGEAVADAVRTQSCFAVLACDLDRFKAVNDSLGHLAGDALLCVVAARMKAIVRHQDTVARLGGDEFAVVLANVDGSRSVAQLAERLIAAVCKPVAIEGRMVEIGMSVGFTVATGQDVDADKLFKRADIALYEAKAAGRNTFREFCPDIGARIAIRSRLGLDMKDAIRRGEFRLLYQPVIDARTGEVVSMEALVRWYHSVHGVVSPVEFIPVAEETGLIVPLGDWALREACMEAINWPSQIRVAVNVSAIQLRGLGLEASVVAALARSGLTPERLKLEVTESVLMQDTDSVIECLQRLQSLGVRVALDDFGTGYSSLSYLRRFPFDKIKLDRSFIRDIADPEAAAIVRAVVGIGERLGMGIVAEGVETPEQLELVRREGCTQVQGFLFSQPLDAEAARSYAARSLIGDTSDRSRLHEAFDIDTTGLKATAVEAVY